MLRLRRRSFKVAFLACGLFASRDSLAIDPYDSGDWSHIQILIKNALADDEHRDSSRIVHLGGRGNLETKESRHRIIEVDQKTLVAGVNLIRHIEFFLMREGEESFKTKLASTHTSCLEGSSWDDEDPICLILDQVQIFLNRIESVNILPLPIDTTNNAELESDRRKAKCGIYLAPSTIPNSGNGMFLGIDVTSGKIIETQPNMELSDVNLSVGSAGDYSWDFRPNHIESTQRSLSGTDIRFIGGLGALANGNLSQENVQNVSEPYFHRSTDARVGAITEYQNARFYATKTISSGDELFVEYGYSWFASRNYDVSSPESNEKIDMIIASLFAATLSVKESYKYVKMALYLIESITRDNNLAKALQKIATFKDFELFFLTGTPVLIKNDSRRPLDWLEKHGRCIDHIYLKQSELSSAGRGAFLRRKMKKGDVLITSPLLALEKKDLEVFFDKKNTTVPLTDFESRQLILNYVFGHPQSSIVFYPLNLATFINHASERGEEGKKPNAEIRWAVDDEDTQQLLEKLPEFVKEKKAPNPFLEFVATRDIETDEEVLIDYGKAWEDAWNIHSTSWPWNIIIKEGNLSASVHNMNKHKFESSHSWSKYHMTICDAKRLNVEQPNNDISINEIDIIDEEMMKEVENMNTLLNVPCKILKGKKGKNTFDIIFPGSKDFAIKHSSDKEKASCKSINSCYDNGSWNFFEAKGLDAEFLRFTTRSGRLDHQRDGVFRHEIRMPDNMFPDSWKDSVSISTE
mmetsp:Transcript_41941/g.98303  ORF Transcript_41941/g.98303 Transcript_41941/m.98303 type:complete len:749 (-) Transcript_41941:79-2325(-)